MVSKATLVFAFLSVASASAAAKVNVEVLIESYCPCSGQWQFDFEKYVLPTVGSIVNLKRQMDGSPHSDGSVHCFHGSNECKANTLGLCAQNQTTNWQQWLNFTVCNDGECKGPRIDMQFCEHQYDVGKSKGEEREKMCAAQNGIDWNELQDCYNGQKGKDLLYASAKYDQQHKETYGMTGLPVVTVNGKRFSKFWDCNSHSTKLSGLIREICNAYEGDKPAACSKANIFVATSNLTMLSAEAEVREKLYFQGPGDNY